MANEYYVLDDNPQIGKAMMSVGAIGDIAKTSIRNVKEAVALKKDADTCKIKMLKNGDITIDINVRLSQGADIAKVCEDLQREIYDHVYDMTGIKARSVNIAIAGFVSDKEED